MKPIEFKEQTATLLKPHDLTDEECGPLPVYQDGSYIISCWKMNFIERIRALLFGKIWLWVHSEYTQPPVALQCMRTAFFKAKEWGELLVGRKEHKIQVKRSKGK